MKIQAGEAKQPPTDPKWKRAIRGIYAAALVLIWFEGMAFFYVHERFIHEGSLKWTPTQTEFVNEHGTLVYLTHAQISIDHLLLATMSIGVPALILSGLFLHFVVGIRIFSNMLASRGILGKD